MLKSIVEPQSFINAQNRGREAIIEAHKNNSIDYTDNMPFYNSKKEDISNTIDNLIEFGVFDYDDYSYSLILTEEYNSHLSIYVDSNIIDINQRIEGIKRIIRNINAKKKNFEYYDFEINKINSIFRSLKRNIDKSIESLNDKQLKFKGEQNFEIRKINLTDCKDDLEFLSEAVKLLDIFLLNEKVYLFKEFENESLNYHINSILKYIQTVRDKIIKSLNDLTKYLIQIEKEAKKIERINKLYKLKYSNELFERTDAKFKFERAKEISPKIKIKNIYYNDSTLIEELVILAKNMNIKIDKSNKKEEVKPEAVKLNKDKKLVKRVVISTKKVYEKFLQQDQDLSMFLNNLNLDRKKYLSVYIRVILNYSLFLKISKEEKIHIHGFILPKVSKRGINVIK